MMVARWTGIILGVFTFFATVSFLQILWRRTCLFHHRAKRYIAMDYHGSYNSEHIFVPGCSHMGWDFKNLHRWVMRWICDACQSMGEHCWDRPGEWKLEGGRIVADEKKYANRR